MEQLCPFPQNQRDARKLWEVVDISVPLYVVMTSQVIFYAQAHPIVHIKYVQCFVNKLYFNEAFFKSQHDKYIITERTIQSFLSISTHANKQKS